MLNIKGTYLPFIAKGRLETCRGLVTNYQLYASIFSNSVIIHCEFMMCQTYTVRPTSCLPEGIPVKTLKMEFIRAPIVELSCASRHMIHSWTPICVVGSRLVEPDKICIDQQWVLAGLGGDGGNMNLK